MKLTWPIFLLLLIASLQSSAQNLLPNGNFEQYVGCPSAVGQMDSVVGWRQYHTGTPDFFHTCATVSNVSIPSNSYGYQAAASGNAYAGVFAYTSGNFKEYIYRNITPLTIGELYEVTMSVNLANVSAYGTSDIGAWFNDAVPRSSLPTTGYLPVTPQASFAHHGFIMDTAKWVRLTGAFVADSAYDTVVIGGFGNPASMAKSPLYPSPVSGAAYYYIDSVVIEQTNISFVFTDTSHCVGDTINVTFLASTIPFSLSNTFSLQLSDGAGSFSNPVTIASVTGNNGVPLRGIIPAGTPTGFGYRLRIVSSNIADTSAPSQSFTIGGVVPAKPVASSNYPICELDTVKLFASSTTTGVSYRWAGPNNFLSTQQNPQRSPANPSHTGKYIVTAWLNGCTARDTEDVNVIVTSGNIVAFSNSTNSGPNPSLICEYDTLKLWGVINVPNMTDIKWSVNTIGNVIAYSKDTMFIHPAPGAGIYTLSGRDGVCFARSNINVRIKPMPPNFHITANNVVCEGDSLYLNGSLTIANLNFLWTGPNGLVSAQQNLVFDPVKLTENGRYILVGTVEGCVATDTVDVEVRPTAGLIENISNSPLCEGDTLKLSGQANAPNNAGFLWVGPNGMQSAAEDTIIANATSAVAGQYILFGNFNNCSASDTLMVEVRSEPDTFQAITNSPVCEKDSLKFYAEVSNNIDTFKWKGPFGFISNTKDTFISNAGTQASGQYILTAYYGGCSVSDTITATVKPLPDSVYATGNTRVCEGGIVNLAANTTSPGATFSWTGPGFASTSPIPSINTIGLLQAGVYKLVANLDGCKDSTTITITVIPKPIAPNATSNSPLKIGDALKLEIKNPVTGLDYNWHGPSGFTSKAVNPILNDITISNAGLYIVTVTENGCSASDSVNVIVEQKDPFFKVYPNANNGNFTISASVKRDQEVPVNLIAANGQLVYETKLLAENELLYADMRLHDRLASGIYTLRLFIDGEMKEVKLVVRK